MKLTVDVKGLREVQEAIKDFSERRVKAAMATALTRTAQTISQSWQAQIDSRIDRPVARTQSATAFKGASANSLLATVFVKDQLKGTAPAEYLSPQEAGGGRRVKKFERSLIASGAMPAGYITVPGKHAQRDSYGNVSKSLLIAILSQIGTDYSPGYARTISKNTTRRLASQAKRGRRYVAVLPGADAKRERVSPGIYERMADGSRKAVLLYQRQATYRKRLDLVGADGQRDAQQIFEREARRAVADSAARLMARGAA